MFKILQRDKPNSGLSNKTSDISSSLKILNNYFKDLVEIGRKKRIYILMAMTVGSRKADQCRSHHQKMIKYHGSIDSIISYVHDLAELSKQSEQQNKKQK